MRNKLLYIVTLSFALIIIFQACSNEQEINYRQYFVNGKGLYEKNCQGCHGTNGEGLGTLYPPLTDTLYLSKNKSNLACTIKNGLSGKVVVKNINYDGEMPGNSGLADMDIAQIIVYITNSFGNKQGFYDPSAVTSDLKGCDFLGF